MRILALTGDDSWAVRARRAAAIESSPTGPSGVERYDLADDGGASLVKAATTMSLFSGVRVLVGEPAAALSESCANALAAASTDAHIILWGSAAIPVNVQTILGDRLQHEQFPIPRGRAIDARVDAMLLQTGVRLSSAARANVIARAGEDLPRALGTLMQLAHMALLSPTDSQVERLLGSSSGTPAPWVLADALERGELAGALEMSAVLEPVATVNYLSSRMGQVARVLDEGVPEAAAVAAWFGWSSTTQASKLIGLARRLGPEGVAISWDLIAAADRAVKVSPDASATLDILLVKLCRMWSRQS